MIASKFEEISFANEQIAGMLSSGIPLEGAIRKVAEGMGRSPFRNQVAALGKDLSEGVPFEDAVAKRTFPGFYRKMLVVGAKTDRLPETLTAVADYYRSKAELTMKLSGLMVYPAIVLVLMILVSVGIPYYMFPMTSSFLELEYGANPSYALYLTPTIAAVFILALFMVFISVPSVRNYLSWRINPFRLVNLANLASMLKICLENGIGLPDAIEFVSGMEEGAVRDHLMRIRDELGTGEKPADAIEHCRLFPGTFKWLVRSSGNNLADGFGSAAELCRSRAESRIDVLLYTALPFSILLLAALMIIQVGAWIAPLIRLMSMLGNM